MDELTRAMMVAGVFAAAGLLGWAARRRPTQRRTLDVSHGPFPAAIFFGSESCLSCQPAWQAITDSGLKVRQYTWEADAELFEQWGIEEVPLLWVTDGRGRVRSETSGVPTHRELSRAKSHVGAE